MNNILAGLLEKYKNGTITPSEWRQLREMVLSDNRREPIENDILLQLQKGAPDAGWKDADADAILQTILSADANHSAPARIHRIHFGRTAWFRYAAAIIVIIGLAGYGWLRHNSRHAQGETAHRLPANTIMAATNGAVLTLADGSNIVLDTLGNRRVAAQNGAEVVLKNGQLVYDPTGKPAGSVLYNTITTAKGKQFDIVLPDGTTVYLNAASSLRYPTAFTGKERRVEVSGEAYFEVSKDPSLPFKVSIDGQTEVEVLGTSFNVNAYKDENSITTTLVDGSVRVMKNNERPVLKPGQEAHITEKIHVIKNADVNKAIAWKNGIFNFEGVGLREMMRQLERWYNIDVVYAENVPDEKFFGKISRKVDLATVLAALKGFGLHFEMKTDRKLIVFP